MTSLQKVFTAIYKNKSSVVGKLLWYKWNEALLYDRQKI